MLIVEKKLKKNTITLDESVDSAIDKTKKFVILVLFSYNKFIRTMR